MSENAISLSSLHEKIQAVLKAEFESSVWIVAEISELKVNQSGHCYLELIEKDEHSEKILAKAKATIWSYTFRMLKPYFETTSGYDFTSGIKILIKTSIEFHSVYGYSLNITDIDPTYTLGDIEKRRLEIINKLKNEGVLNMNKETYLPVIPKNIAIISAETAAGYGDFINQLNHNEYGYKFHHKLFPAFMQGENVEKSILSAFDKIFKYENTFDAVVIIRGGGSKSDLSWFDNYWIAYTVTQFPLPVLTGIGHEQDDTITDMVAHTRLKTPTAVADFLISKYNDFEESLIELETYFYNNISEKINIKKHNLNNVINKVAIVAKDNISNTKQSLSSVPLILKKSAKDYFNALQNDLNKLPTKLTYKTLKSIDFLKYKNERIISKLEHVLHQSTERKKYQLEKAESFINLSNPLNILEKGYSITLQNGKIVKDAENLKIDSEIETIVSKGRIRSKVLKNN